jgi:DNA-binding response OmpR family regulator
MQNRPGVAGDAGTSQPVQVDLSGYRVLVVEDSYFIALEVCDALMQHGATIVGPIADIADPCARLRKESIDCAVLDINVRGGQVFALARELMLAGVPLIFATGYSEQFIPKEFCGCPVVSKPIELSVLISAIVALRAMDRLK